MTLKDNEHVMLLTIPPGADLDGYVFADLAHAVAWLRQGTEVWQAWTREHMRLAIVTMRMHKHSCPACGHQASTIIKAHKISIATFLSTYAPEEIPDA